MFIRIVRWASAPIFAVLLILTAFSTQAQEQFREIWRIGNWNGYIFTGPLGHFDRCTTVVHYTNGYTLGFSVDRNAQIAMRVTSNELNLNPGARARTYVEVDGRSYGPVSGANLGRNQAAYELERRTDLLRALRRGNMLSLSGDTGRQDFSLVGSAQALRRMAECIPGTAAASGFPPSSRRGVASAPPPPDAPPGMFAFDAPSNPFNDIVRALEDD